MSGPLAIDLFAGLGGWTEGLLAEGWEVVGFDIERHEYDGGSYPAQLVIQDVLTLHGSQFGDAALIVASPPCQEYSYMAMPWTRAKAKAAAIRADKSGVELERLNRLFNACFRIQREACEAAGHHIPLVVENVRGAIPWVGRSRWNYGSYHLWGDVPALMPPISARPVMKGGIAHRTEGATNFHRDLDNGRKNNGGSWFNIGSPGQKVVAQNPDGRKVPSLDGGRRTDIGKGARFTSRDCDGRKQPGLSGVRDNGKGDRWFQDGAARSGSKSNARKAASARIAKIPPTLSRWIAAHYKPDSAAQSRASVPGMVAAA